MKGNDPVTGQIWHIVPSDYYKPMMIDKYIGELVPVYKTTAVML